MSGASGRKINRKRFIYSLMPLLLLLVGIIALNLLSTNRPSPQPISSNAGTPAATRQNLAASTVTRPPILQATILPSPTPTITPLPTIPAEAAIVLLGPPVDSSLPGNGRLSFYWTYSEQLLPGQELVLTLRQSEAILGRTSLSSPNFGTAYQAVLDVAELAVGGTAVWQVQLQWQGDTQPLLVSQNRPLLLTDP